MQKIFFSIIILFVGISSSHAQDIVDSLFEYAEDKNISLNQGFRRHFDNGENYFRKIAFTKASESFISAALESKFHPAPYFYLAFSLFANQQYDLAGDILRRAINLYPYWNKADFHFQTFFPDNFEYQRKKEDFERWLLQERRKENTYVLFGFLCQFSGDKRKAKTSYELALAKNYAHMEAQKMYEIVSGEKANSFYLPVDKMLNVAHGYLEQGKFSYAINEWGNIIALYPEKQIALYQLAHSLMLDNRFPIAVSVLSIAFKSSSTGFDQQFDIEHSFGQIQHFEQAIESLEEKIGNDSKNLDFLFLWSYLSFLNGEKDRVKIALEHLRDKDHRSDDVDFLWKKFLETSKNKFKTKKKVPRKTKDKFKKTKRKKTKKKVVKASLGLQEGIEFFYEEKLQKAAQSFTKQITNPKNSKEALWLLCMTSFAMGKYDATYGILKKVILDKKIGSLDWVHYYSEESIFQKQLQQLAEVVQQQPTNTKALSILGYILATTGNKRQAKAIFNKLIQRIPNDEFGNFILQLLEN